MTSNFFKLKERFFKAKDIFMVVAKFGSIREAFCARYRCAPQDFDKKLFFKSLRLPARIISWLTGWYRPQSFNIDISLIQVIGDSRSEFEVNNRLAEFQDWNRLDRSFRRNWLKIRVSNARVKKVLQSFYPELIPVVRKTEVIYVPKSEKDGPRSSGAVQRRNQKPVVDETPTETPTETLEQKVLRLTEENTVLLAILKRDGEALEKFREGRRN